MCLEDIIGDIRYWRCGCGRVNAGSFEWVPKEIPQDTFETEEEYEEAEIRILQPDCIGVELEELERKIMIWDAPSWTDL